MSTRLQVVMDESEAARYEQAAARRQLTLSEWVRRCLREALKAEAGPTPEQKWLPSIGRCSIIIPPARSESSRARSRWDVIFVDSNVPMYLVGAPHRILTFDGDFDLWPGVQRLP